MSAVDLHAHSRYSDGVLSPDELCALAVRKGITVLALSDHDTTEGLAPMQAAADLAPHLLLVPAVELNTGEDGRTHVLGYGVPQNNETLNSALRVQRQARLQRGQAMLDKLAELGYPLPPISLTADDSGALTALGRGHVARALVAAGYVHTMEQAFDRLLNVGKPAYIPLPHLSTADAVELLASVNAVPVLAHPAEMGLSQQSIEALVQSLIPHGLRGLEVYHPSASRRDIPAYDAVARRNGLLVTGGSDFHGNPGTRSRLGGLPSGWIRQQDDLQALLCAIHLA